MSLPLLGGMRKNTWPFSPQCLPNCVMWLDAADTSTYNTASVAEWRNKGYAYGSTSGSGGFTSTNINGIPALSIAANQSRTAPSATYTQTTRSVFTVTSSIPTAITSIITSITNTADIQMYIISGILNIRKIDGTPLMTTNTNIQPVLNTPAICCATTTNTSSPSGATQGIFINGTSYALDINATGSFGTTTTSSQSIGWSNAQSFTLGEVLIFDGALTDIQRQQVEGYLAVKWGLQASLPATHPYKPLSISAPIIPPFNRTFQPVDIAGCQLWLDAADATTIVGTPSSVSGWTDKSGLGNDLSSNAGTPQYTTDAAGYKALYLNGSSTMIRTPFSFGPAEPFTIFIVSRITITSNAPWYTTTDTTGVTGYFPRYDNITYVDAGGNNWSSRSSNIATGTTYISAIVSGGTTGSELSYYENAAKQTMADRNTVAANITRTNLYLGYRPVSNERMTGNIYEFIQYNTALTNSQRLQIEAYLAQKWGLQSALPSTPPHPGRFLPSFSTQFTPKTLGPALWLDAADPSTITLSMSNEVTAWNDKSGYGYQFIQAGSTSLPTYTQSGPNGMYVVSWNGSQLLQSSTTLPFYTSANSGGSFFFVFKTTSTEFPRYLMNYQNEVEGVDGGESLIGYPSPDGSVINFSVNRDSSAYTEGLSQFTTNTYTLMGLNLATSGNSPANVTFFKNGESQTVQNTGIGYYSAGSYPSANNSRYLIIGGRYYVGGSPELMHVGTIAEIIWFRSPVDTRQRQQVEGYLAWKWGTQGALPSTHPYKKFQP